jgi:hypothetical protein
MLPLATTNNYKKNICCHRQLLKIKKKKKSCHRQLPNLRKKMYVAATKQHKNYDYEKMKKKTRRQLPNFTCCYQQHKNYDKMKK